MVHAIKQEIKYFEMTVQDKKNYEIRKNDRDYKVGDYIALNEWDPVHENYSGRSFLYQIESVLSAEDFPQGLNHDYVILGLSKRYIVRPDEI